MTRLVSTLIISFLAFGFASSQTKQNASTRLADVKTDSTVIQVPTVVCSSCVTTITRALKKVPGVKSTSIDLKKKTATVTFVSSKVSVAKIEKAISNAGYDANSTKRNPAAYEKLDACCKTDAK